MIGFTAPLRKRSLPPETRVLVLGAGGVSRAAIAGLRRLGLANITLTNRRKERAEALCNEFGLLCAPWEERGDVPADLIINTTPLGMTGAQEHETPYPWAFQDNGIAYDLIYTPFQTRFCATPRLRAGKPSQASTCSSGRGTRNSTCGRGTIFRKKP